MTDSSKKTDEATAGGAPLPATEILRHSAALAKTNKELAALSGLVSDPVWRAAKGQPVLAGQEMVETIKASYAKTRLASLYGRELGGSIERALKLQDPLRGPFKDKTSLESAFEGMNRVSRLPFGAAFDTASRLKAIASDLQTASNAALFGKIFNPLFSGKLASADLATLGLDHRGLRAFGRSQRWANTLSDVHSPDFASIMGHRRVDSGTLDAIRNTAKSIHDMTAVFGRGDALQEALRSAFPDHGGTAAKLAMFAGATDVLGPASIASRSAYEAIMGGYDSSILGATQLARPREMVQFYRDLAVDEGLVEADKGEAIALLVESGLVEGQVSRSGAVSAIVEAGPMRVKISAHSMRANAYSLVDSFEVMLRAFIAGKLEPIEGKDWFRRRASGELVAKAKARRRDAMRSGEASVPLIHYLDLGDLISIIGQSNNWREAFEMVFDRLEDIRVDLARINASRRPMMHARPLDAVRLTEIVMVIHRLIATMEMDGGRDAGWDADV